MVLCITLVLFAQYITLRKIDSIRHNVGHEAITMNLADDQLITTLFASKWLENACGCACACMLENPTCGISCLAVSSKLSQYAI